MNNHDHDRKDKLETTLFQGKNEAHNFFSRFSYEKMTSNVLHRLARPEKSRRPVGISHYPLVTGISALAACFVLIFAAVLIFKGGGSFQNQETSPLGAPVSQQIINLNDEDPSPWLNFFPISKPDQIGLHLLAVIWQAGKSGDYEMAYSSLFENSNKPCPVALIAFPGDQPPMVIISSQNVDQKYLHYRVLGYKGNKILSYLEQNYVTGGEIEVINGILKETRLIPNKYVEKEEDGGLSQIITYYIPFQLNKFGDIVAPVEKLKINKGEYIALIGNENNPIEALHSRLLLDWEPGRKLLAPGENIRFLYAQDSGQEDLYIKPIKGGIPRKISVEVIDLP